MTNKRKNAVLSCLAAALVSAWLAGAATGASAAEYYRWTDANGVVHMSDKRPETAEVEVLKPKPPTPRTFAQQEAKLQQEQENAEAQRQAEAEAEANAPAAVDPSAPRELRCQQERERLSILSENEVVHMQDANGNLKTLDNSEIQREIAVTEKAIAALCN